MAAAVQFTQIFSDPGLDWARIAKIRSWTKLPVILKGIHARRRRREGRERGL